MIAMDILSSLPAITAVIVIVLTLTYFFMKNRGVLPGPRGLPYLGLYTTLEDDTIHEQLQEYGRRYGDLYSFTFLGYHIVNLGSAKAIREVHVNKADCFAGRFTDFNMLTWALQDGVAMVNGEAWKVLRKYFAQTFKEYGLTFMKDNTAGPLYDALVQTIEDIRAKKGEAFNVIDLLIARCMGTIQTVVFGESGVSDEILLKMNEAYGVSVDGMIGTRLLLIGKVGRLIFSMKPVLREALTQHIVMRNLIEETLKKIESTMDENNPTCLVEHFYKERNDRRRKNDPSWKYFSDKCLISSLTQIIGDGILSVAYYIGCFLHALVEHPEEQDKIYHEVMEVVGPSRLPTVEDKSRLHYTIAFMNEVTRTSNFFTLFPSMECTKETTVRGCRIPKGAITLMNFWQAHHDPQTYENPEDFNPSRFLSSPEKPRAELPVSFGMGRRSCTGEPYVTTQAFLFLASIVKCFTISEPPNPTTKSSLFLLSGQMELCIRPRTES